MNRASVSMAEEEHLVVRCLCGDTSAWETMFHVYHPQLVSAIRGLMHGEGATELAEEIAAVVWASLCSEGYRRLRQYDPRFSLLDYLTRMARCEIQKGRRSSRSRFSRECRAARKEATLDEIGAD